MVLRFVLLVFLAASVPLPIVDAVNSNPNSEQLAVVADTTVDTTSSTAAVDNDPASAARAENERYYEHVRLAYLEEDCVQFWGEFPIRSEAAAALESSLTLSTSSNSGTVNVNVDSMPLTRHRQRQRRRVIQDDTNTSTTDRSTGGMPCNCGMLYDLGQSSIDEYIRENGFVAATPIPAYQNIYKGSTSSSTDTSNSQGTATHTETISAVQKYKECVNGYAGDYPCNNIDLVAYLPKKSIRMPNTGAIPINANDVWGWTSTNDNDGNNREFVIWGVEEGTFFIEIFDNAENNDDDEIPLFVWGYLPSATGYRLQRDMKVIGDVAYVGSESTNHGLQVFDMNKLLDINPDTDCLGEELSYCKILQADTVYRGGSGYDLGRTHNIVANAETNYLYLVGGVNGCYGGLHVVDVADPLNPKYVTCFGEDGYVHDAHCVVYKGPDTKHYGKEICVCFSINKVTIVDVSNKNKMKILSKLYYEKTAYTHQGWLSSDHTHVVFGDEMDESAQNSERKVYNTRTLILEVRDLENPSTDVKEHFGDTVSIDHNQYVVPATAPGQDYDADLYQSTDLIYQANYNAGLTLLQVIDYDEGDLLQVGSFQTHPYEIDYPKGVGAWSSYPYFASGLVPVSSIMEGLFIVRPNLRNALKPPINDKCQDNTTLNFKNRNRGCDWVGKTNPSWPNKRNRKQTRKRCKKIWGNSALKDYCPTTCGRVGKGVCKNLV